MDNRASSLRRQARAAERYSRLTDQIRTVEARLIYARCRDAASAAEIARTEAKQAEMLVAEAQEAQQTAAAYQNEAVKQDRKSTRLNSSHSCASRMPSFA